MRKLLIGLLAAAGALSALPTSAGAAYGPLKTEITMFGRYGLSTSMLTIRDSWNDTHHWETHNADVRINAKFEITGKDLIAGSGCKGTGTTVDPIKCSWTPETTSKKRYVIAELWLGNDILIVDPAVDGWDIDLGEGDDIYFGGSGADVVRGRAGNDVIAGRSGNDRVYEGSDAFDRGAGDDIIDGGAGDDKVYAGIGNDIVTGGPGADYLDGYYGDDTIKGGAKNDTIFGNSGKDIVLGEGGTDLVSGGEGKDTFDAAYEVSAGDRFDFSYRSWLPFVGFCQKQFYDWYLRTDEGDLVPANGKFTTGLGSQPFTPAALPCG